MSNAPVPSPIPQATPSGATAARPAPKYTFRGEGNGLFQRFAWNTGRLLSRIVSMLLFRLHVTGQMNIPKTGGVLIVVNHQSFFDPWLMGIAPTRQVHYMARDTLFKGGMLHWLMETLNTFPVKRGAADLGAIRNAVDRLDRGFLLTVFPEGTRSEDGSIGDMAAGFSLILNRCKTDVAVMPVVVDGAFEAWPRDQKFPHPHPIRIRHGKTIPASEWRKLSAEELAMRVRAELVALQAAMGSPHAEASQRRLEAARARPATQRRRR